MAEQLRQDPIDEVATSIANAVHVAHDRWEEVQGDERLRGVVFFARHCLEALDLGETKAATEALSKMDHARALIDGEPL
jgi:hypothetical protein